MRIHTYLAALLLLALVMPLRSQSLPTEVFEIVVIEVEGCRHTAAASVRALSGLRIGDKLELPGTATHLAIRRLLKQGIFEDVAIEETRREQDLIWLRIQVQEAPLIGNWSIQGLKPKQQKDWLAQLLEKYPAGSRWTKSTEQAVHNWVENQLVEAHYAYDSYDIQVDTDTASFHNDIQLRILRTDKPILGEVKFAGQTAFPDHQLQKAMGIPGIRLQRLRPDAAFLDMARAQLLNFYHKEGYADARILSDSLFQEGDRWHWALELEAGTPYYIGSISWRGNSRYETAILADILDIEAGEVYSREQLETRLLFDPEGRDVSSLYMDYGHLFFRAEIVETGLRGDSIDLEIHLNEGPISIISSVAVEGNERTHESVILRELYTHPGQPFSRQALLRSQRALLALGYFDPASMDVKTDVDPASGEVALTYIVTETRNDKLELSASFRPSSETSNAGLIGTLGFSFNNFSLRGLLEDGWENAQGGGQQLGIRAQSSGTDYQSYNLSFTEPWLNGKARPFSAGIFHQRFAATDSLDQRQTLSVSGGSLSLGQRLNWGQGGWTLRSELGYQHIRLNQLLDIELDDGSVLNSGRFNNLYLQLKLAYRNLDDPFFPTSGRLLELSGQWTPPFPTEPTNDSPVAASYRWLSYHKYRLQAAQYLPIAKNLVFKGSIKMGWLAGYDAALGAPPFERFELGGDGNAGSQQAAFAGNDILALRGYAREDIAGTVNGGAVAFSKATAELRYQFLQTPATRGYLIGFAEGGNAWKNLNDFNPLDMQRSVGLGIRMQLPMFGTIGFDYGLGLDQEGFGWNNWNKFGQLNLVLGFEPE